MWTGRAAAHQLDRTGRAARLRTERLEQAGPARGLPAHLRRLDVRLARRARPAPALRRHLRVPHGGPGAGRSLDLRARHPAGRRRAPDVPARLQRFGPGHPRRAHARPLAALSAYEAVRSGPTARVVRTNREHPPDYLIRRVEELVGDGPFDDLDRYITRAELQRLSDKYKRITGFAPEHVT